MCEINVNSVNKPVNLLRYEDIECNRWFTNVTHQIGNVFFKLSADKVFRLIDKKALHNYCEVFNPCWNTNKVTDSEIFRYVTKLDVDYKTE